MEGIKLHNESEREFAPKEIVRVRRGEGETARMEEGWEVGFTMGDRVFVSKDGYRKMPKIEELREWNS